MPIDNILAVGLLEGLLGLAILVVLWPNEKQGRKVLRRWGVEHASAPDIEVAVGYLRRRRFWYPWLFFAMPLLMDVIGLRSPQDEVGKNAMLLVTVLLGGLIAEVLAQRPPKSALRTASLKLRGVLDFIPRWGVALHAVITVAALVRLVAVGDLPLFGFSAGITLVIWLVVLLAVRRPPAGDLDVDEALRLRSARVAVGLGTAIVAGITATGVGWPSSVIGIAGVATWVALTAHRPAAPSLV